jgi:hypothetical protein
VLRRTFALPKEAGQPSDDALAVKRRANRYALCDGASACYAGGTWARLLCRHYVCDPEIGPGWLETARAAFQARAKPPPEDWLGQIVFDRGSFSTLLGFTVHADRIEGVAIGDTVLFIKRSAGCQAIPPFGPDDFAADPVLLSSQPGHGAFKDTIEAFDNQRFIVPVPATGWCGTSVFAMTDALAAWVVSDETGPDARLEQLAGLRDRDSFRSLVRCEVSAVRMRRDDATLVVIEL